MSQHIDASGRTWQEFARDLFEYEYCAECHGDTYEHEGMIVLGNWFAHCRFSHVPACPLKDDCNRQTDPVVTMRPRSNGRWAVIDRTNKTVETFTNIVAAQAAFDNKAYP